MGGEIDTVATPGEGSTFWFTVTLDHVQGAQGFPEPSGERGSHALQPKLRGAGGQFAFPSARPEIAGGEKRRETRFQINYPTLLKSKTLGVALIRVLDVSRFGLRVAAPFRLPTGTEVEIRLEDKAVRGLVRNCGCMKAYEFHAGIELLQSDSIDERGLADLIRRRAVGRLVTAKVT
jgi:hypothetical protein